MPNFALNAPPVPNCWEKNSYQDQLYKSTAAPRILREK
jgi:hypothetical protein